MRALRREGSRDGRPRTRSHEPLVRRYQEKAPETIVPKPPGVRIERFGMAWHGVASMRGLTNWWTYFCIPQLQSCACTAAPFEPRGVGDVDAGSLSRCCPTRSPSPGPRRLEFRSGQWASCYHYSAMKWSGGSTVVWHAAHRTLHTAHVPACRCWLAAPSTTLFSPLAPRCTFQCACTERCAEAAASPLREREPGSRSPALLYQMLQRCNWRAVSVLEGQYIRFGKSSLSMAAVLLPLFYPLSSSSPPLLLSSLPLLCFSLWLRRIDKSLASPSFSISGAWADEAQAQAI